MNHFAEYNIVDRTPFDRYFGFTDAEVDGLYQRYLRNTPNPCVSRDELREWYGGFCKEDGGNIYNPNSIVSALMQNRVGNYWIKAGEYKERKKYVTNKHDGVKEAVVLLTAEERVKITINEYASTVESPVANDEILSVMAVYGYLNYSDGCVKIPNRESQAELERKLSTASA